ncbi:MAG: hypothetical protein COA44_12035 [Arcobacter sp.]|nr:MAG: hypothetical protein COA44_12035 [Arcobacter sp.]
MIKIYSQKSQNNLSKKAFTLVELIFSIVIIAIVFTVIPRLMAVTTKTMELSIKEDGLFAAISLMGNIIRLPWDSNTLSSNGKILDTSANTCNDYRVGGFLGSRNCLNSSASGTPKANFGTVGLFGDIDDYDTYNTTTLNGRIQYNLDVSVDYADVNLNPSAGTNELKKITVNVSSNSRSVLCSDFFYYSANLGHVQINKRAW